MGKMKLWLSVMNRFLLTNHLPLNHFRRAYHYCENNNAYLHVSDRCYDR